MKRPKILQNGAVKIAGLAVAIIVPLMGLVGTAWEAHGEMLTSYNGLTIQVALLKQEVGVLRQDMGKDGVATREVFKSMTLKLDALSRSMAAIDKEMALHALERRLQR